MLFSLLGPGMGCVGGDKAVVVYGEPAESVDGSVSDPLSNGVTRSSGGTRLGSGSDFRTAQA